MFVDIFNTNNKYQIIYADPPWQWDTYSLKGRQKTSDRHYALMKLADLQDLPISKIADSNSILFMWVQDAHLKNAIELGEKWGFKYKTIAFIWDKNNFGMGYWTRKGAEVCLLFTKGVPKRKSGSVRQFISSKAQKHSQKPLEVSERIVKLMGECTRIELFARQQVDGWDYWGNEVGQVEIAKRKGFIHYSRNGGNNSKRE